MSTTMTKEKPFRNDDLEIYFSGQRIEKFVLASIFDISEGNEKLIVDYPAYRTDYRWNELLRESESVGKVSREYNFNKIHLSINEETQAYRLVFKRNNETIREEYYPLSQFMLNVDRVREEEEEE
jgi:hypothetical protein